MSHLQGKRILLTRTKEQNKNTAQQLKAIGAIPVYLPCIQIDYLKENIQQALKKIQADNPSNTDIIFSSSNGVKAVATCVHHLKKSLQGFRIIAVGHKTAQTLAEHGCTPAFIPEEASQKGLIAAYQQQNLPQQVYFFRAEEGSDDLLRALKQQGVDTLLIPSYRASCPNDDATPIINQLRNKAIDAVLLGSAKTAAFYVQRIANLNLANTPVIAVMSPQVEKAADKLGLKVQIIANKPSFRAMLQGLNDYFATQDKG
ncbi:uroporphyrinogen-III synthase [Ghiorsea bivora]|uniref:uroporphyrinogen-III synthase n=1 Tax=Ghiorsea bivora TaxID=1485545 RepID=UPI000571DF7D|nr:uroporphyrinogen-III synthase [Ghiorsea bivora]